LKRLLLIFTVLLASFGLAQDSGPLTLVESILYPPNYSADPRVRQSFETAVRGLVVVENDRIGRLKDLEVITRYYDLESQLVHQDRFTVDVVESKSQAELDLYWMNPANLPIQRIEGTIQYETREKSYQLPFSLVPHTTQSPVDSYNKPQN